MLKSATQQIAEWSCGPSVKELPAEGRALVRRAFLDTLAVTLLGSRLDAPRIAAQLEFTRGSIAVASVQGMGRKADVLSAALINGTSAHAELFDDNNAPMISHPSAPLVSALLPLAQSRSISGQAVIDAYAVGFEVGVTLGRMLNPTLYKQGWHATRVLGILGSTAACCRLISLDAGRTTAALGIAVSMAGGVRQNFGTMTMALHVGLTARDAVHAALLAEAGMGADNHALDGKYGLFQVFSNQCPQAFSLGNPFELLTSGIIFKPYPCGAPTHAAVDAALALRNRFNGDCSRIVRITCLVHPWNAMTLREEEPQDVLQAKVNLRYCVAAALLYGELTFRQFSEEALADPALPALMRQISVHISDDLPDNGEFPAEVHIETTDACIWKERRDVPRGGSTRPLSYTDIVSKFRSCSQLILDAPAADLIITMVRQLDSLDDVRLLCETLEGQHNQDVRR